MHEEMKKMGLPETEFESLRGDFKVIFRKEKSKVNNEITQKKFTDKFTHEFTDKFTQEFNENEIKILNELDKNPNLTQVQLSTMLNISRRSIIKNMKKLKDKNKIERVGSDRKGYWKILK